MTEASNQNKTQSKGMSNGDMTLLFRYMGLFEKDMPTPVQDDLSGVFLPKQWKEKVEDEACRQGLKMMYHSKVPGLYEYILCRTIQIDLLVRQITEAGQIAQWVILGAGFDSRAHRFEKLLKEKKITVFELDLPDLQNMKIASLANYYGQKQDMPCYIKFIPTDFNESGLPEQLMNAGYDAAKPTLFIMEGVTFYLDPEGVAATLRFIQNNSPQESFFVFDYLEKGYLNGHESNYYGGSECMTSMSENGQAFSYGISKDALPAFLKHYGMTVNKHWTGSELGTQHLISEDGSLWGHTAGYLNLVCAETCNT